MKIGREPDIAHGFILVDLRAQRHRLSSDILEQMAALL